MASEQPGHEDEQADDNAEKLTQQEYQWCIDHLEEASHRIDRVIDLVEGTDAEDRDPRNGDSDLRDARARVNSALLHFQQGVTPEETSDE